MFSASLSFLDPDAVLHTQSRYRISSSIIFLCVSSRTLLADTCEVLTSTALFISSSSLSFIARSAKRAAFLSPKLLVDHEVAVSFFVPREVRECIDAQLIFWTTQRILKLFNSHPDSLTLLQVALHILDDYPIRVHSMVGLGLPPPSSHDVPFSCFLEQKFLFAPPAELTCSQRVLPKAIANSERLLSLLRDPRCWRRLLPH